MHRKMAYPGHLMAIVVLAAAPAAAADPKPAVQTSQGAAGDQVSPSKADTALLGGKIITVDAQESIHQAIAIRDGRIAAVGSDAEIGAMIGDRTTVINLRGKTVVPGFTEEHVHATDVATALLGTPYAVLSSIAEVQDWIRRHAAKAPAGTWIVVPRNDITRLAERRHPTVAELDAACTTHPVAFNAARKWVLNTRGLQEAGILKGVGKVAGGRVLLDQDGNLRMIAVGDTDVAEFLPWPKDYFGRFLPAGTDLQQQGLDALEKVLHVYNEVGITSINERGANRPIYERFCALRGRGGLTTRVTLTFLEEMRKADDVRRFVGEIGLKFGEGDDWIKAGPLKILVDGGIHWGTTCLREPYGPKRANFYVLDDPNYRGNLKCSVEEMASVFAEGHKMGWQMCCHVTGDGGVDRVLDALDRVNQQIPLADRRFTLLHAYFPAKDSIQRCKRLGVCVGTHPCLYYKDSDAMAEIYGQDWAERFIGLADWCHGGVPVALSSDHMEGLDPDGAMNSFNPMLQMYVAVSRKNEKGRTYGPQQKLTRMEALRAVTIMAAYVNFREKTVGSLEPGKFADLVVLDRDYLTCPEEEIRQIKALRTMVGGKTVYERR